MTSLLDMIGLLVRGVFFGAGLLFGLALATLCLGFLSGGWQVLRDWVDERQRRQRKMVPSDPRPDPHWDAVRERMSVGVTLNSAALGPPVPLSRSACCGCPTMTFELLHEDRTVTRIKHRPECPLSVVNAPVDWDDGIVSYDEWSRRYPMKAPEGPGHAPS